MEIVYTDKSLEDLEYWKKSGNSSIRHKISNLIAAIQQDPFQGIGKPERLRHHLSGCWSRRINKEHRIIYKVNDNEIIILALRFHYDLF